ncbi:MAG TPA: phosphoenolpyruvate carboxykinase (ATP), partial [Gemmatimonadaceae bacterium]|nr:phosphoenolpyruvate carboxykinase (ATP) [Gemmatimonadaceae bacterium]
MTATHNPPATKSVKTGVDLTPLGLAPKGTVHANLVAPELIQEAIRRGEGELADMGPFVGITKPHTGRSPNDKFVVKEPSSEKDVDWGKVNQPMTEEHFNALLSDMKAYLNGLDDLFVQDLFCGAHESHRLSVRYVTPNAWHAAFVRNMFIRPDAAAL